MTGIFYLAFHVLGSVAFALWIYSWVRNSKKKPENFS